MTEASRAARPLLRSTTSAEKPLESRPASSRPVCRFVNAGCRLPAPSPQRHLGRAPQPPPEQSRGSAMLMSRQPGRLRAGKSKQPESRSAKLTRLDEYIKKRDYTGALALLEFNRKGASPDEQRDALLWIGYCACHAGNYQRAHEAYEEVLEQKTSSLQEEKNEGKSEDQRPPREVHLYAACCLFYMQSYEEAEKEVEKYDSADSDLEKRIREAQTPAAINNKRRQLQEAGGKHGGLGLLSDDDLLKKIEEDVRGSAGEKSASERSLRNRLLFHCAHKRDDQDKLMQRHQDLTDANEDQLSLAAIHYLRSHFQEATDIYKRLLLENRDDLALNVYVAMCYYKLDYYDVSLEILAVYLQAHPDSAIAVNLKACNHFRLYNGKAAEAELKVLQDQGHALGSNDLIRHNRVVFSQGEGALQVLPRLADFVPEARLNLVIYHLRHDGMQEAHELIKDVEPSTPQEYILKGVVNASVGQALGSREHVKMAQQFFQLVGASASECDTIPGRQCMASCFFLLKQFEDVNIYLNSIKAYMYGDDDFNWNHGISLAQTGNFRGAEEALLLVQNERYKAEYCYVSWLARCFVMNGQPKNAWELYLKMDTSNESFNLLQLIANDCYRMGQFLYAAKAFDVLERLDPDPEFWEGKRGACVGVFQQVVAGKGAKEDLRDVLAMVRNTSNPQVEYMVRIISKWAASNGVKIN